LASGGFTPVASLGRGLLIGASVWLLLFGLGRVAGVSGILGAALRPSTLAADRVWRLAFLVGLVAGAMAVGAVAGHGFIGLSPTPWPLLMVAGAAVGLGTGIGNGCTSGHGVCGVARLSARSIAATAVFLSAGVFAASVVRRLVGL
jgi:hypothetical protein